MYLLLTVFVHKNKGEHHTLGSVIMRRAENKMLCYNEFN